MSEKQDKVQKVQDVTLRLIEARSLLATGWIQDKAHNKGSYCIVGAIYSELLFSSKETQSGPDWRRIDSVGLAAETELEKLLSSNKNEGFYGYVSSWNDKPGRTQEEVLHLMDTAIGNSMNRG